MTSPWAKTAALLAWCGGLAACGGGAREELPVNTDYSALRLASSHEGALSYATSDEQLLRALRNGLRMSLVGAPQVTAVADITAPSTNPQGTFSATTVQVDGVDEADLVKYDGRYIYAMRPEAVPATPGITHNVLAIAHTDPATAGTQLVSEFSVAGEQSSLPQLYQVQSAQGATEFLAAVSQDFRGWVGGPAIDVPAMSPTRTRVQLLDVRDPANVSQAWQIELDGWLRASRMIGDTLYLVNSYRPRLAGFKLPATTDEQKRANERRIRDAAAAELLPSYRENGGANRPLLAVGDCVLPADLSSNDAYSDLVVITAVSLSERRVTDVNCISTDVNGVYVSHDSLYVGGIGISLPEATFTVLHKFALEAGDISYRATGVVGGQLPWQNPSYFMDEHEGNLRILTSQFSNTGGSPVHRLYTLHEVGSNQMQAVSILPNPLRPTPIGKPGEQVHAVRFFGDRAYVVTARVTDPLYVLDLSAPADPVIAGTLEIPGVSTYLQPLGAAGSEVVLAIGGQTDPGGIRDGVKVELFDVRDVSQPRSIASKVFGRRGSSSEAMSNPHALTLYARSADRVRVALPIDVFATPRQDIPNAFDWNYSGSHLFEIQGLNGGTPQLEFKGVIKTAESDGTAPFPAPFFAIPKRTVLHDDAVFVVNGATFRGSLWNDLTAP
jgi:beta propeller domain-containing protein